MLAWRTSRSEEIARSACPGLDPGAIRPYRTRRFHSWHCGIPESSVASLREVRPLEGNSYMNGASLLQIRIPCQTLAYQLDKAFLLGIIQVRLAAMLLQGRQQLVGIVVHVA